MFPPVVRAVVISPEEKILMVRHRASDPWVFPWGHVEAWEALHDAIIRELREELGITWDFLEAQYEEPLWMNDTLTIIPLPLTGYTLSYERDWEDRSRTEYIFALTTDQTIKEKQDEEIIEYGWFDPDDIVSGKTKTFPMNQKIIVKLFYGDEE